MIRVHGQGARVGAVLGWAIYLAVSWTWCIGMFLPILLLRDFGPLGYIAFAVPNVLGAAAMGWLIMSPEASRRFVQRHRAACVTFSLVTALFHFAFVLAVIYPLELLNRGMLATSVVLLAPLVLSWLDRPRATALITYAISVGVISTFIARGWIPAPDADPLAAEMLRSFRQPAAAALMLAPACVFGFLLCPYLDLTFHRARQNLTGTESPLAFGIGFAIFFLAMILFTIAYAPVFTPRLDKSTTLPNQTLLLALLLHLTAQSTATIAFHLRELHRPSSGPWGRFLAMFLASVAVIALGWLAAWRPDIAGPPALSDEHQKLVWYRIFMSFYGLVFPGYVWLLSIPTRDGHAGPRGSRGRKKLRVLVLVVALAAPCFWLGFVERETWWLLPGMAVMLGSRLLITPRPHRRGL